MEGSFGQVVQHFGYAEHVQVLLYCHCMKGRWCYCAETEANVWRDWFPEEWEAVPPEDLPGLKALHDGHSLVEIKLP